MAHRMTHLVTQEEAPSSCRYKYILSGYRVKLTFGQTVRSLAYPLHNETFNVWTHLAGFFLFVALGVSVSGMSDGHADLFRSRAEAFRARLSGQLDRWADTLLSSVNATDSHTVSEAITHLDGLASVVAKLRHALDDAASSSSASWWGDDDDDERAAELAARGRWMPTSETLGERAAQLDEAMRRAQQRLASELSATTRLARELLPSSSDLLLPSRDRLGAIRHRLGHTLHEAFAELRTKAVAELPHLPHLPELPELPALRWAAASPPPCQPSQSHDGAAAAAPAGRGVGACSAREGGGGGGGAHERVTFRLDRLVAEVHALFEAAAPALLVEHAARAAGGGGDASSGAARATGGGGGGAEGFVVGDESLERWPLYAYVSSALMCLGCSSIYHLFGTANESWQTALMTWDYSGIVALIFGSTVRAGGRSCSHTLVLTLMPTLMLTPTLMPTPMLMLTLTLTPMLMLMRMLSRGRCPSAGTASRRSRSTAASTSAPSPRAACRSSSARSSASSTPSPTATCASASSCSSPCAPSCPPSTA